jgi:hypothetical protein
MLLYPAQHDKTNNFFTRKPISDIWSRMRVFDAQLSNFERRYSVRSEFVYQLHLKGEEPENIEFVEDFKEWANTYHLWIACQQDYSSKFGEFRRETTDTKQTFTETKLEADQEIIDDNINVEDSPQESPKQSGIDFLMSIAGMFDSGTNNTSENVKSIVSDFILKKHGKTRNGSAN